MRHLEDSDESPCRHGIEHPPTDLLRSNTEVLNFTVLRNDGGKLEFIPGIFVNDDGGFAFDFHFVRGYPARAFERGQNNFSDLV
jgi:hypothetical protein